MPECGGWAPTFCKFTCKSLHLLTTVEMDKKIIQAYCCPWNMRISQKERKERVALIEICRDTVSNRRGLLNSPLSCPQTSPSRSLDHSLLTAVSPQCHQGPLHCLHSITVHRKLKIYISQICVMLNDHLNA